jgi:hypothetical protein
MRPAGDLDVLGLDRALHRGDRQVVRLQLVGVQEDPDLALARAGQRDLADAVDGLRARA